MAEEQINSILTRLLAIETAITTATPTTPDYSDPPLYLVDQNNQPVDPEAIEDIPDLVKALPTFNGEPSELHVWLDDAEKLVNLYRPKTNGSINQFNKFHIVCRTIRRKVRGEANNALVSSNVNLNWLMIKNTLLTYYGEKRDLATLDCQLMSVQQRGKDLEKYYNEVSAILSHIANHVKSDSRYNHPEASKSIIEMYNEKAMDAFIRGLDGDMGKFLKNYRAESLAQAYNYCNAFINAEFRKNYTKLKTDTPIFSQHPQYQQQKIPPKIPPRIPTTFTPQYFQPLPSQHMIRQISRPQYNPFLPRLQYNPNPQYNPYIHNRHVVNAAPQPVVPKNPQYNPYVYNRQVVNPSAQPFVPKNIKPEPIDTDVSMRTVNYINRPLIHNRNPKQFHIETECDDIDTQQYFENLPYTSHEECPAGPSFERYAENLEYQYPQELEEHNEEPELNFLE